MADDPARATRVSEALPKWRQFFPSRSFALILRLLREQGPKHWRAYAFAAICMAMIAVTTALSAWIMKDIINKIFIERNINAVWLIGGLIVAIFLCKGLAIYGQQVTLSRVAARILADIQRRTYEHMLGMDVGFYSVRHSAEFVASQEFIGQSASNALSLTITLVSRDLLSIIGLAGIMISQDPTASMLVLLVMPAAVVGIKQISRRIRSFAHDQFRGIVVLMESLQESAQGIRVIKAYNLEAFMRARHRGAIENFERMSNILSRLSSLSLPLVEAVGGLAIAAVVVYGGLHVIHSGEQPGGYFAFITALLMASDPIRRIARLSVELNAALFGVTMLYEFLDRPCAEAETDDGPPFAIPAGRIEFRDVTFGYRDNEPVLNRLDLVAAPGRTTALVGRSGGGKTTIMNLLLRFYAPGSGQILIDGQDIARFARSSIRRQIAYVSQDTFLFNLSIRENIRMGRPGASDEDVTAAARAAHADAFIRGFERGYDSPCGERGLQLSGGQRQRIAIARAFLKNAPIILLDEATSALDTDSESAVQQALQELCLGRTTLVIAHRLSTIAKADAICVIEGGRVIEQGTHTTLLAKGGHYAQLAGIEPSPDAR